MKLSRGMRERELIHCIALCCIGMDKQGLSYRLYLKSLWNFPVSLSLWSSSSYSSSKCVYAWLHCALTQFDPFIVAPWPTQIHHAFTPFFTIDFIIQEPTERKLNCTALLKLFKESSWGSCVRVLFFFKFSRVKTLTLLLFLCLYSLSLCLRCFFLILTKRVIEK